MTDTEYGMGRRCFSPRFVAAIFLSVEVSLLAGCGQREHAQQSESQVVATVSGDEITQMQLNQRLAGAPNPTATDRSQALESLINESLLVQAALKSKLDQDPGVIEAIETGRRQILAQAYLERSIFPNQPVTDAEVTDYYNANPMLFAHRRSIVFAAFTIPGKAITPALQEQLGTSQSQQKVNDILTRANVPHEVGTTSLTSEQIPLEDLTQFYKIGVGDVVIRDREEPKAHLLVATEVGEEPKSLAESKEKIRTYLANARRREAAEAYLKQARSAAKVEERADAAQTAAAPVIPQPPATPPGSVGQTIASGIK
jgi:peptidyl-prolyl cis-trans isomerase C